MSISLSSAQRGAKQSSHPQRNTRLIPTATHPNRPPMHPVPLFLIHSGFPHEGLKHLKLLQVEIGEHISCSILTWGTASACRWHADSAIRQTSKANVQKLICIPAQVHFPTLMSLPLRRLSAAGNLSGLHLPQLIPSQGPSWVNTTWFSVSFETEEIWFSSQFHFAVLWQNTDFTLFRRCDASSNHGFNYISAARKFQLNFLCLFWPQKASFTHAEHSLISVTVARFDLCMYIYVYWHINIWQNPECLSHMYTDSKTSLLSLFSRPTTTLNASRYACKGWSRLSNASQKEPTCDNLHFVTYLITFIIPHAYFLSIIG